MTLPDTLNPGPEVVDQLRQMFKLKMEQNVAKIPPGGFHERDMNKVMANDVWLTKFLENNDLDIKKSLDQLWETCVWRKTSKINEISEDTIRLDYAEAGIMFARGRDLDGKTVFIYRSRLYTRGSRDLDELKRVFLYWLERCIREAKDDYITFMFELTDAGLGNVDMDFTKYIITTLKNYYPYSLNYILVYDLPWILNATFQIIKRLLPAKAVDRLRNINNKNIREYIDDDNMLVPWGGKDDYEFQFIPEQRLPEPSLLNNNNYVNHNNNNIKKVHFANLNPSDLPMNETAKTNHNNVDGEMLRIIPQNNIVFTKSGNELVGNVEIINIHNDPVTYKIKTTAPEKFRVRPSTGVLPPGANVTINVVLQHGHQVIALNREKFLVMCMAFTHDLSTSSQDLADLWKNTSPSSDAVEQHRLKCSIPPNLEDGSLRNGLPLHPGTGGGDNFGVGAGYSGSDSQLLHFQQVMAQLNETTQRLETQSRHHQRTQIISIVVFLLLSIAIVYILKAEIKNTVSQYH